MDISFYHSSDTYPYDGTQWVRTNRIIPNHNMVLYSISMRFNGNGSQTYEPVIYRASDQQLLARGYGGNIHYQSHSFTSGYWSTLAFDKPVFLQAGVEYRIGLFSLGAVPSFDSNTAGTNHDHISGSLHSIQWVGQANAPSSGSLVYPSSTTSREMNMRFHFELAGNKTGAVNMWKSAPNTYYTTGWTVGTRFSTNTSIVMKGLAFHMYNTGNFSAQVMLHDLSGNLLASSTSQSIAVYNVNDPFSIQFTTPATINPSTTYVISVYSNGGVSMNYSPSYEGSGTVYATNHSGVSFTRQNTGSMYASGAAYPASSVSDYITTLSPLFDMPNSLPNAPTGLTSLESIPVTGNPKISWTHNDPDSDPQAGYQIRWRKV